VRQRQTRKTEVVASGIENNEAAVLRRPGFPFRLNRLNPSERILLHIRNYAMRELKSILKKYFEYSICKILSWLKKVFKIRISNTSISNTAQLW